MLTSGMAILVLLNSANTRTKRILFLVWLRTKPGGEAPRSKGSKWERGKRMFLSTMDSMAWWIAIKCKRREIKQQSRLCCHACRPVFSRDVEAGGI